MLEQKIAQIGKDVDEIKSALIGNAYNDKQSINNRLLDLEQKVNYFENLKHKAIGILFAVSFFASIIYNIIIHLLKK